MPFRFDVKMKGWRGDEIMNYLRENVDKVDENIANKVAEKAKKNFKRAFESITGAAIESINPIVSKFGKKEGGYIVIAGAIRANALSQGEKGMVEVDWIDKATGKVSKKKIDPFYYKWLELGALGNNLVGQKPLRKAFLSEKANYRRDIRNLLKKITAGV